MIQIIVDLQIGEEILLFHVVSFRHDGVKGREGDMDAALTQAGS